MQKQDPSFNIAFRTPSTAQARKLTPWLAVLDDQLPVADGPVSGDASEEDGLLWLRQVLTITMGLLNILHYPLFDLVEVLQCRKAPTQDATWHAVCRYPDTALVSPSLFEDLLKTAFRLAAWACEADAESSAERARFFAAIEHDVLKRYENVMPKGKSTLQVLRAAHKSGVPYLLLPGGAFQLGWGANARLIDRSTTDRDSVMGMRWTQNKLLTASRLRQAGLPAPVHTPVRSLDEARKAAEQLGFPVVVKPADMDRGEGVSVDVDAQGLEAAFNDALTRSMGQTVLVEQQVEGTCYRLFVVAGELLYAVKRQPIGVYADGKSTIQDLVTAEFEVQQRIAPWSRRKISLLDEMAFAMLSRQGLTPETVPPAGQFVALRRIESTALGGIAEDVTEMIHRDNARAAVTATKLFGLEVAGVDIISTDIAQPWHANGAVINEVNYSPLLGSGPVQRKYAAPYLSRIVRDQGRIPIYQYRDEGDPEPGAFAHWEQLRASGLNAYLVSPRRVLGPDGTACALTVPDLVAKVQALLMRMDVQALVVAVRSPEDARWLERLAAVKIR